VAIAFVGWGLLMLHNLRGARGMPGVVAHGWTALVALAITLASALSLAGTWLGLPVPDRGTTLALHLVFAPYGFMGMLALGLSYILVPMFALADTPSPRRQLASCALAIAALALGGLAAFDIAALPLRVAAVLAGAAAVALHLWLMAQALRTGMRKELGRSFLLVKIGWGGLVASLAFALALAFDAPLPRLPGWFALALVGVWLLSFLAGMLQRIVPFLAALHADTVEAHPRAGLARPFRLSCRGARRPGTGTGRRQRLARRRRGGGGRGRRPGLLLLLRHGPAAPAKRRTLISRKPAMARCATIRG
jgi:hypothetical protein